MQWGRGACSSRTIPHGSGGSNEDCYKTTLSQSVCGHSSTGWPSVWPNFGVDSLKEPKCGKRPGRALLVPAALADGNRNPLPPCGAGLALGACLGQARLLDAFSGALFREFDPHCLRSRFRATGGMFEQTPEMGLAEGGKAAYTLALNRAIRRDHTG